MVLIGQYDAPFARRVAIAHCDIPFLREPGMRALHRAMCAQKITWRARDNPNPRIMTLKHSNPVGSDRQVKPPRCQI